MTCGLIDVPCHIESWFWGLIGMVPFWGWAVLALIVVGAVWKFAGWPGLVALGAVAGFILGRRQEPVPDSEIWPHPDTPKKPRKTAKRTLPQDSLTK